MYNPPQMPMPMPMRRRCLWQCLCLLQRMRWCCINFTISFGIGWFDNCLYLRGR